MVVHCLSFVDENYAREWPRSWKGPLDVDSGPVIPILNASPSSSGLAFLGAAIFDDTSFLSQLLPTLNLAGFPILLIAAPIFAILLHLLPAKQNISIKTGAVLVLDDGKRANESMSREVEKWFINSSVFNRA